uniref:Phosphofructokinase domain-containing protein n=1 Tax=Nelumbo nucifera TaxID=4432 RepID=A0A822YK00_NELNU|nr:TPA_asm: hypothetical protein HUJ06_010087 [Nelumbo nucifera]
MCSVSSIKGVGIGFPEQKSFHSKGNYSLFGFNFLRFRRCERHAEKKFSSTVVRAAIAKPEIDFSDPYWKNKFKEDFENRFDLPHLRDVFDIKPMPTTFSLHNRGSQIVSGADLPEDRKNGYVNDDDRALLKVIKYSSPTSAGAECIDADCSWVEQWVHRAGPRKQIYFEPEKVNAGIVTCGGLCPGLNDVIRQCHKRKMKVSVVCVPKTIDNDILLMDKTFGFDTSVEEAQRAINSAYIEAHSAYHGIGLVKLMGRSSGFIAMHASLSSGQIDVCLIPEVPFKLDGPYGVLQHLEHLIETKGSAVVCVAEGAGQDMLEKSNATDASGNVVLGDIGVHIQQRIKRHFKEVGVPADVKYIDPTYMIRACRPNASDAILCTVLGQNAVHGAFAGYSGITVGICNTHYVYLPIPEVIASPRTVDPNSRMWHRCLTSTGQPDFM